MIADQRVKDAARILTLEYEVASLENFLQNHTDTEGIRELRVLIEQKNSRIQTLEYTIAEFEDFLKENPDVRDLHVLKNELSERDSRIGELENWIERNNEIVIEKARIVELEQMVTNLEDYVKIHDVDQLKIQLREREERIEELEKIIELVDKEIDKKSEMNSVAPKFEDNVIFENNEKIIRLEKIIVEKDLKIANCESEICVCKEGIAELRKVMMKMTAEIANYEAQDIDVLKEEIRVRDERIVLLEDEIDSLERAFTERIDLEQIEQLVKVIKNKEDNENRFENDLREERRKNEELAEALRTSVLITSESENKLNRVQIAKRNALERVGNLEQRIASMQTMCALKCQTCQPLLSELRKSEKKLERFANERRSQLRDLRHVKREALRAALSEKDAHLALLELFGLKTSAQIEQAENLRADKARLLEKLKQEDNRSIEQSEESDDSGSTVPTNLLTKILEPPLAKDEDYNLDNVCDLENTPGTEKSADRTNGHTNNESSMTKKRTL